MKLSMLFGALSAVSVMALPGASRLNRAFKEVTVTATSTSNIPSGTVQVACIECPCDGFDGNCKCVFQGCCCDWTIPDQPPTTGWKASPDA